MRRTFLALSASLAVLAAGSLLPTSADAMTLAAPAGVQAAINENSLAQDVAYVCRRVWRCGYYGCGWRRACYYTPGYYGGGYGYYGPPRRYYRRW